MGIILQTWSMIMSVTMFIPWLTHLLTVCEVEGDGSIVAVGWTPWHVTGGWMGLVVFVCVGPDWWALTFHLT